MIVKMKFINISGPRTDIDRVTEQYLSKYEIQLESALSELKTVENLRPFVELNPYRDSLSVATQFAGLLENPDEITPDLSLGLDEMFEVIRSTNTDYLNMQEKKENYKKDIEEYRNKQRDIAPFRPLDCKLEEILNYKYINYRFGRIPIEYYHKLLKYLMNDLNAIFVEGERDESSVYGAYFMSPGESLKVDAAFRSLHFEKIPLNLVSEGTPADVYRELEQDIEKTEQKIDDLNKKVFQMLSDRAPQILGAQQKLEELSKNFDVRKMAARMQDNEEDSYILCGWMAESDVEKFLKETENDENVFVMVEEDKETYFGEPPTKLKNPKLFKPFEMYVQMYGLPAHNEMDPTIFVGLTYSFIFGAMFGDVGQGLLLAIIGGLLYFTKKIPLAGIIGTAGIFSTFFGFMFGSVFGFEDIIDAVWLRPINSMTTLPFIGKLNTVFIVAVAFGMGVIIFTMILHIINALRSHDPGSAWFDVNGAAGLVFYASVVATVVLFMTGRKLPGAIVMAVMFGVPLLLILFKEPLTRKIQKRTDKMEESKAMFLVQGFFELFETLLSYFSNTLSFVRIGAFAVSHAAMMEVVLMLAGVEQGNPNWLIVILGNLFVCGMEGLIVGIQVLRLEYYEMFSRFYKGSGRAFTPYTKATQKKIKKH